VLSLVVWGCSPQDNNAPATAAPERAELVAQAGAPPMPMRAKTADRSVAAPDEASPRRYVAVRHELNILTAEDGVEAAWKAANQACVAAGCEVLTSVVSRDEKRRPSSASLQARVPPAALDTFLAQVTALGSVGQHARSADDQTDAVIDTEARLRNMTAFRDRLRGLLATPGARLKDVIDVERELVRVQSELDSLASRRKALAQLTDMVHVSINFLAEPSVLETGIWVPVREAIAGAGHGFAASVAKIISLLVFLLPWALAALLAFVLVRAWRHRRHG
jgi:Domain of unknown function (DUF4349)